jgi:hypothetical protein
MSLQVALTTMTLKLSLQCPENISAKQTFTNEQLQFITVIMNKVEGKTIKQKNPSSDLFPLIRLIW